MGGRTLIPEKTKSIPRRTWRCLSMPCIEMVSETTAYHAPPRAVNGTISSTFKDWKHLQDLQGVEGFMKPTGVPARFELPYPPVMEITPLSRIARCLRSEVRGEASRIDPL